MKILTAKQKAESLLQIMDNLKIGSADENESLAELAKLGEGEFGSDLGQLVSDAVSIGRSLALRPVSERTSEPLLTHALSGLRVRSKPFLTEVESGAE